MSLMNGNEARLLAPDKITATCMLCPNAGVRAAMKSFGNGVICYACAIRIKEARNEWAWARRYLKDPYDDRASALGFYRVPIVEPLCVRQQKRSWKPFAEFVAMAFILTVIVAVFVIAGD